jgi:hypothetical protein
MRLPCLRSSLLWVIVGVTALTSILFVERAIFGFAVSQVRSHGEYIVGEAVVVWVVVNAVLFSPLWLIATAAACDRVKREKSARQDASD